MTSKAAQPLEHRLAWLRPVLVPALLAAAVLLAGFFILDNQSATINHERHRNEVLAEVSLLRAKLEGNINGNIQLVRGLVAAIATEPEMDQQRFSQLAEQLFNEHSQLRSIAAAPDLVVNMTYPLAGNEKVIGLDYRKHLAQRDEVLLARDTGQLVLAGPVELVQGGQGLIGRFPVFTDTQQGRQFWGVVSAVVDVDRLYAESGLLDPDLDIQVSITKQIGSSALGTAFFGTNLRGADPVTAEVHLPTGAWQISGAPKGGWTDQGSWPMRIIMLVAGLFILLPVLVATRLVTERQSNFRLLKQRERELLALSHRLELALDTSKVGIWEMNLVTDELVWDERMDQLYGLPPTGGKRHITDWENALHPEDRPQAELDFVEGKRTGTYRSDFRSLHPDGAIRHIRSIGAIYTDSTGQPKIVGVNWDVTADVMLNAELKRAKAQADARNKDLEAARDRIEHNALHDSLTGLPNRRYLDDMLRRHAEDGYCGTGSIALLHLDLDRFKQINDTLGHAAGDAMLVHASRILRDKSGPDDFVARVGGDEFIVLSTAAEGETRLSELAHRIVKEMRKPVPYETHECRFGVSVGIAVESGEQLDVQRLLMNADIALYRAKGRGRNRYEFFSEALQAEVVQSKRIADDILKGLEREEFTAFYQPQFDARTLDVVGIEALARWVHPTDGIKTPDTFLPVAEELNVVTTIDRMILDQALLALERLDMKGLSVPRASVNVSLKRISEEDLISGLEELQISKGRIAFELVESIYLDEGDAAVAWNIDRIKELGIDIEIDDFGTGYTSIVALQKLRPARLKIDRQLVEPIVSDKAQRRLLASIVEIGKSMDIEIVAEGVETMAHAAILRDLGCDVLQGYAFAKPLCLDELEVFLRSQRWRQAS